LEERQVYTDYRDFIVVSGFWHYSQQLFEEEESARLAQVEKEIKSACPVSNLGCLLVIVLAPLVGIFGGFSSACEVVVFGSCGIALVAKAEFAIRRLLRESELKRRAFNIPEPVFAGNREEYQSRPRSADRHESPPKNFTVTSMRQAYEILGLRPGRTTITEVKKAFHARMAEYHPDKVAHLGVELRELASRKAVQINLAMEFIEARLKRPDSI
jgi:hypothetical protein